MTGVGFWSHASEFPYPVTVESTTLNCGQPVESSQLILAQYFGLRALYLDLGRSADTRNGTTYRCGRWHEICLRSIKWAETSGSPCKGSPYCSRCALMPDHSRHQSCLAYVADAVGIRCNLLLQRGCRKHGARIPRFDVERTCRKGGRIKCFRRYFLYE